jgi:tetratricopeptide (TPR) repeat protein
MTNDNLRYLTPIFCLLVTLSGCATTPVPQAATPGDELRNKNMDVLFATEFPVASMDEALGIAGQAYAAGDIDRAIFFYVRALQFEPENARLLTHIGDIHVSRGDTVMARRAFRLANQYDPELAPALEALGLIYMQEGRDDDAIDNLSRALAADAQRWRAHNALGVYADRQKDYQTAQSHYRSALEINPDAAHVLANMGYSRFLAGDVEAAIDDLYRAANDRGFKAAWGNLATVYAEQRNYEDAVVAFEKVMNDAHACNAAGRIAMKNGDLRHAYSLFSTAVSKSSAYFPEAEEGLRKLRGMGVSAAPMQFTSLYEVGGRE